MPDITLAGERVTAMFEAPDDAPVALVSLGAGPVPERAHQPLVEVMTPQWGNGTASNSTRWSGTEVGSRLRYADHRF